MGLFATTVLGIALFGLSVSAAHADDAEARAATSVGALQSATLPPIGSHFVWVVDSVFQHSQLFDGDSGRMFATIDGGTTISPKPPLYAASRGEFYSVEIDYDRGRRGRRQYRGCLGDVRRYPLFHHDHRSALTG